MIKNIKLREQFKDGSMLLGFYLAFLLLGYLFLDKGFGYLGIGKLYVSEIGLMIIGIAFAISLVRRKIFWRGFLQPTIIALVIFMGWGLIRTIPYLTSYGLMALRDAVLWAYAAFTIAIVILFSEKFQRYFLTIYKVVLPVFLIWLPIGFILFWMILLPRQDFLSFPFLILRAAPVCVHLAGMGSYLLLRLDKEGSKEYPLVFLWALWVLWWIAWVLFSVISRSGMLTAMLGLGLTFLFHPRIKLVVPLLSGAAVILLLIVFNINISVPDSTRNVSISAQQISLNLISLTGSNNPVSTKLIEWSSYLTRPTKAGETLSGNNPPGGTSTPSGTSTPVTANSAQESDLRFTTMEWRLSWWKEIIQYTVQGQYFWLGKGYGINLADSDGFQVMPDHSLRSPHNATMNILARSGVPGLLLWLIFIVIFSIQMVKAIFDKSDKDRSLIALWLYIYWIAFLFNSSFDVFLEGPMGGIWFWSLTGFGLLVIAKPMNKVIKREKQDNR
jgi:hypothetical protein